MNKFVEFINRLKEPFIIAIDPAGDGTTGMYLKFRKRNAKNNITKMVELKANSSVIAAQKIVQQIEIWEKEFYRKADFIAVEELVPLELVGRQSSVPTQIQETLGLIHILKAIYKDRYLGYLPAEKNKQKYLQIRKNETTFKIYKKSEHILDAYLIYDRCLETIYQNKGYKNFLGERIRHD